MSFLQGGQRNEKEKNEGRWSGSWRVRKRRSRWQRMFREWRRSKVNKCYIYLIVPSGSQFHIFEIE